MFILTCTDDSGYTETNLLGVYATHAAAYDRMRDEYDAKEGYYDEDHKSLDTTSARLWTECDGGVYWDIFEASYTTRVTVVM